MCSKGFEPPDPRLRRPLLYPAELRTHLSHLHYNRLHIFIRNLLYIMLSIIICKWKAGDGNRTHVSSLEGWCSTIELHPHTIGVTGFEPATSWSQTSALAKLSHTPICCFAVSFLLPHRSDSDIISPYFILVNTFLHFFEINFSNTIHPAFLQCFR